MNFQNNQSEAVGIENYINVHPIGADFIEQQFINDLYNLVLHKPTKLIETISQKYNVRVSFESRTVCKSIFRKLDDSEQRTAIDSIRNMQLSDVGFSKKTYNCLYHAGINTLGEVMDKTKQDLMRVRNLGKMVYDEISEKLDQIAMHTGNGHNSSHYTITSVVINISSDERKFEICSNGEKADVDILMNIVYDLLCNRENRGINIFDTKLSVDLKSCLILKGYFHLDEIILNCNAISSELKLADLEELANELTEFISGMTTVISYYKNDIYELLSKYEIISKEQLNRFAISKVTDEEKDTLMQLKTWCANYVLNITGIELK